MSRFQREWLALAACLSCLPLTAYALDPPASPDAPDPAALSIRILDPSDSIPGAATVTSGALDAQFVPALSSKLRRRGGIFWLRLQRAAPGDPLQLPVVVAREGHEPRVQLFAPRGGAFVQLPRAAQLPEFGGGHEVVFIIPRDLGVDQALYAQVTAPNGGIHALRFRTSTLNEALQRGAAHARMIALAFGALTGKKYEVQRLQSEQCRVQQEDFVGQHEPDEQRPQGQGGQGAERQGDHARVGGPTF